VGPEGWETVDVGALPGVAPGLAGDGTGHGAFLRAAFEALEEGGGQGAGPQAGAPGGALPVSGAQARHNLALIVAAGEASAGRRAVEVPA
jgi:hypothetical protein